MGEEEVAIVGQGSHRSIQRNRAAVYIGRKKEGT